MKAQAAPVIQKPVHDPLPPVVVKIGGGIEPPNGVPIQIETGIMGWTDDSGSTWEKAWTTFNCQIRGLTVQDPAGSDPVLCQVCPEIDTLTTLTLYFASDKDTFQISEVPGKDGSVYMEVKSSPNCWFEAQDFNPELRCWTTSKATFSSALVRIEFRQRKIGSDVDFMRFEYLVNSAYIELGVNSQTS